MSSREIPKSLLQLLPWINQQEARSYYVYEKWWQYLNVARVKSAIGITSGCG